MIVEPRILQGRFGSVIFGQRLISGLVNDAMAWYYPARRILYVLHGYIVVLLFDLPLVGPSSNYSITVWSKGMCKIRAKIIKGSAGIYFLCYCLPKWFWQFHNRFVTYWRSVAVERLQQVSKVLLIVE